MVDAAPRDAMWKMMLASSGVKTEFLAVAASSKKSVTSIFPSLAFRVALWIVFSTASSSRMTNLSALADWFIVDGGLTVVESEDFRVRDPLSRGHQAHSGQPLDNRVAELMARNLNHDPLKLGGGDKSIIVGIKVSECLSDTFSPEPF